MIIGVKEKKQEQNTKFQDNIIFFSSSKNFMIVRNDDCDPNNNKYLHKTLNTNVSGTTTKSPEPKIMGDGCATCVSV